MRMHGIGRCLWQIQLLHLLTYICRDKLDSRLHFGKHAFCFLERSRHVWLRASC